MHNKHTKQINSKWIIIAVAVGLALAVAATAIFLVILKKNPIPTDASYLSSISSLTSEITSSEEPVIEEPEVFVPTDSSYSSSISSLTSEITSSEEPVIEKPEVFVPKLTVTAPQETTFTTTNSSFLLSGSSTPQIPVTLNGQELTRDENGYFSLDLELSVGLNTFTLAHADQSKTFNITYRYVVISDYSPSITQKYSSGATFGVTVVARRGSSVLAYFNSETISLIATAPEEEAEFTTFTGSFILPQGNLKDLNLGKITFTATHNGVTESFYSEDIICTKPSNILDSNPAVTPQGGNYIDVGSGIIAEVVHFQAETFDAFATNDWSSPINNYLPKGTVDYVSPNSVYSTDKNGKTFEYKVLRYGKQVYTETQAKPSKDSYTIIKEYAGTLPDHNEIRLNNMNEEGRFTTLTFDCLWKAPFYFNIPQSYPYFSSTAQNYNVDGFAIGYVDIVFCYATIFEGEFPISEANPLFSRAEVIANPSGADHTLRLYLKENGGFYGWDAYYNNEGQLVFEFLHPAKITETAENGYGVRLDGITVAVDAGHNGDGVDVGSLGSNSYYHEANRNLNLAFKIKAQLEALGATVVMTRDSEVSNITYHGRIEMVKNLKPDFCISVHHDANASASPSGFTACYGTPFSYSATQFISNRNENTGIYSKIRPYKWHYFYLARISNCPVVLTENGFISNSYDYANILDESVNEQKAIAIVNGIVDYFKSIQ